MPSRVQSFLYHIVNNTTPLSINKELELGTDTKMRKIRQCTRGFQSPLLKPTYQANICKMFQLIAFLIASARCWFWNEIGFPRIWLLIPNKTFDVWSKVSLKLMMNGRTHETQTAFCAKLWITTCTLIIIFMLVIVTESHQLLLRRVYYACMIYTNFI